MDDEGENILELLANDLLSLDNLCEQADTRRIEKELSGNGISYRNTTFANLEIPDGNAISEDSVSMVAEPKIERFLKVDEGDTNNFIQENKAKNTIYKTVNDLKIFNDWAISVGETRDILNIQPEDLDLLFAKFYMGKSLVIL